MPKMKSRKRGTSSAEELANAPITAAALKLEPAAKRLGGLSKPTMYRLIKKGLLRPNRTTRHLLFPISELDRFLRDGMI
jgi:excisionase family DNA binding protein